MFQYEILRKCMGNTHGYVRALIRIKATSIWVKIGFFNSGISGIDVHALYPVPSGSFWDIKNVFNTDD